MKNIWNIFRADWRRLTASVVAVVVLLGRYFRRKKWL